mmetsp:Transcript_15497/g.20179  ORF Transcript_15497/g.20179 Transcript_15497/m.20179 type:complete len:309 (+) Transcript_15497:152-1078(+)
MNQAPSSSNPNDKGQSENLDSLFASYFPQQSNSNGNGNGFSYNTGANPVFIEKPRKCLTGYNFFFKDQREKMVEEQKRTGKKIGFTGMARAVSSNWKNIEEDLKIYYDKLAAQDKARYARELDVWKNLKKAAAASGANAYLPPAKSASGGKKKGKTVTKALKQVVPKVPHKVAAPRAEDFNMNDFVSRSSLSFDMNNNQQLEPLDWPISEENHNLFYSEKGESAFLNDTWHLVDSKNNDDCSQIGKSLQELPRRLLEPAKIAREPTPIAEANQSGFAFTHVNSSTGYTALANDMGFECQSTFLSMFRD